MSTAPRCPTCRAPFRGELACARCGTDLAPLMAILRRARDLREEARRALGDLDLERARTALEQARALAPLGERGDALNGLLRILESARALR